MPHKSIELAVMRNFYTSFIFCTRRVDRRNVLKLKHQNAARTPAKTMTCSCK